VEFVGVYGRVVNTVQRFAQKYRVRATLEDMELVLETLELAERQKIADEQEIATLHRGLRHLHCH
jgi:hypothetical protein